MTKRLRAVFSIPGSGLRLVITEAGWLISIEIVGMALKVNPNIMIFATNQNANEMIEFDPLLLNN